MVQRTVTIVSLLVADLVLRAHPLPGVSTLLWLVQTQERFRLGQVKGVSLTPAGEVILAPPLDPLCTTGEPYAWSLAKDRSGNIYVGTGNGGQVFKIAGGRSSLYFDAPGAQVYSLAVGPDGALYVGSSPEGAVYRVSPGGESSRFFQSEEKYIWSMVFDTKGNLCIGCGEEGKIYSIDRKGEGRLIYDSEERHVLSLLSDRGKLYAGTEGRGVVYEVTPQGEVRGIFDPPQGEVRSLLLHPSGDLYVAAIKGGELPSEEKKAEKPSTSPKPASGQAENSAVYRVSPNGTFTKVFSSSSDQVLSLSLHGEKVLAGTGNEGRLYLIDPLKGETDLLQCEESQILSLLEEHGEIYLATGNMGKVYRLGRGYGREGELISKVQDTGTTSRWGAISWAAEIPFGTGISLETRTGNTEEVDKTWSDWSREYSKNDRVESPPARFIQWKAILRTSDPKLSPSLSWVQVTYLPQNLPPIIASLSILPPGVGTGGSDLPKPKPLSQERKNSLKEMGIALPDQVFELDRGARSAWWVGEDGNGDSLMYTVYFKGEGEREWKMLKEGLRASDHTFDSFSLPDGYYRLRLEASDVLDNPKDLALSAERVSEIFLVDNSPPQVETPVVDERIGRVRVKAMDSLSLLSSCEYSTDGGEWRRLFPLDTIFDATVEEFRFEVKGLKGGEHTIAVRVTDQSLNVGSSKRVFYTK